MMKIKTDQPLFKNDLLFTKKVRDFWNKTSEGWKTVWGLHIHHGYYDNDSLTPLEAQEKLIEKLAALISIRSQDKLLDVGCGMGGSSIYLAKNYHVDVEGITLSSKQVSIASQLAQEAHLSSIKFKIEDALSLSSFDDNLFDVVWSLESCEQFYNKALFIHQAYRVLKPGGKLLLATWCSDQDSYVNELAQKYKKLCLEFDLPYMPTMNHYQQLLEKQGFIINHSLDWSNHVKKSWDIGIKLANAFSFLQILKMSGLRGFRFVKQIKMMQEAFHQHRIRYGVFVATKRTQS